MIRRCWRDAHEGTHRIPTLTSLLDQLADRSNAFSPEATVKGLCAVTIDTIPYQSERVNINLMLQATNPHLPTNQNPVSVSLAFFPVLWMGHDFCGLHISINGNKMSLGYMACCQSPLKGHLRKGELIKYDKLLCFPDTQRSAAGRSSELNEIPPAYCPNAIWEEGKSGCWSWA